MKLKKQSIGRINWKRTFEGAKTGDTIMLPIALRGTVHGAARTAGYAVTAETTHDKQNIVVTIIDSKRADIMRDFAGLSDKNIDALHKAAKQGGLIA